MSNFQMFLNLNGYNFSANSIAFSRPIAEYITLEDENGLKTPTNLRYYKEPKPPLDLNRGYDKYIIRVPGVYKANLKIMENFLMENDGRKILQNKNKTTILTSRNVLKLVMTVPYWMRLEELNTWYIKGAKIGNTICLVKDSQCPNEKTKNGTYHFKFQQYCFADSANTEPNVDIPVNENKQTFCVFKNTVEEFNIYYTAEIAGIKSDSDISNFTNPKILNECKFVNTKLLFDRLKGPNQDWKNERKVLHWWIQAFLGRAEDMYFGFKTIQGFVRKSIIHERVDNLPNGQTWKPNVCKHFLYKFLKEVKRIMENVDDPNQIFEFKFDAKSNLIEYRVSNSETFITDVFINYLNAK